MSARLKLAMTARLFTESNLFISCCAASFCVSSYWYFGYHANALNLAFVFFATLFTYNFQRMAAGLKSYGIHNYMQCALVGISVFSIGFLVWRLSLVAIILFAIACLLSVGYSLRCVPNRNTWISLRQVPHLKLPVIVLVWLVATAVVPYSEMVQSLSFDALLNLLLLILQQGGIVAVIAVCFDIRDLPFDDTLQRTLPQRFGVDGAIKIGKGILWVSATASAANYLLGNFSLAALCVAMLTLPALWRVLSNATPYRSPVYFELYADGILLLPALGFILLRLLQI